MRAFFETLFEQSHFNTGISITPFSISHIVYLILIFGGTFVAWYVFHKKETSAKEGLLRILAYLLVISYLSDFFFHDFVYGGLNIDKLPFHICTVLCPLIAFAQFNKRCSKLLEPVAILSILAPMMYLSYPASVGSGEPWCYQAIQTMLYHGVQMAWGILTVSLGFVNPDIRKSYKCGLLLIAITLWASLGNAMIPTQNWFYLQEDAFYIGLVGSGTIPKWTLSVINPIVFFAAALATYGVCYAVKAMFTKKKEKEVVTV